MTMTRTLFPAMVLTLAAAFANAAIVTFSGVDPGANSTDPRPNANAAAAACDASGNETIYDFESQSVGPFTNLVLTPGVTINGKDVSGSPQTIQGAPIGAPEALYGYNTTVGGTKFVSLYGGSLTFTFDRPIVDFCAYFTGGQINGSTIKFNDGSDQTLQIPNPGSDGGVVFFGFLDSNSPSPIYSLTIDVDGDIVGIDDVRISYAPSVPEPSTIALLGIAVAGLGFSGWRTAKRVAPQIALNS